MPPFNTDLTDAEVVEKTPEATWEKWNKKQTPQEMHAVVKTLRPTIDWALKSSNAADNAFARSQAELITARAIKKWDPKKGAALKTYVASELQRLPRMVHRIQSPVHIPERWRVERGKLYRHESEFFEKEGRHPSTQELSDETGIPISHIKRIRKIPQTLTDAAVAESNPAAVPQPEFTLSDYSDEALGYVYHASNPKDQRIFEALTGYNDAAHMTSQQVARELGISESQVSRRFARMMMKATDIEQDLQKLYT